MKDLILDSLDTLLKINDELSLLDLDIEGFLRSLEKRMQELDPKFEIKITSSNNNASNVEEVISIFSWDKSKYPKENKTIRDLVTKFNEKFENTKMNIKSKSDEYSKKLDHYKTLIRSDT